METNILPLAAGLVARPYSAISLCTGPSVQGDDEGTRITAVVRHDMGHIGDTIQTKGIACTNPCYVGLQHTHARIAHLLNDVTLQES